MFAYTVSSAIVSTCKEAYPHSVCIQADPYTVYSAIVSRCKEAYPHSVCITVDPYTVSSAIVSRHKEAYCRNDIQLFFFPAAGIIGIRVP